jgi:hypothetical protein
MFRVIVAGSRTYTDYSRLCATLDHLLSLRTDEIIIISGCARGADTLGERYAAEHNHAVVRFPAQWELLGKRAGSARNQQMLDEGQAHALVAFPLGASIGTRDMIRRARAAGISVRVIEEETVL